MANHGALRSSSRAIDMSQHRKQVLTPNRSGSVHPPGVFLTQTTTITLQTITLLWPMEKRPVPRRFADQIPMRKIRDRPSVHPHCAFPRQDRTTWQRQSVKVTVKLRMLRCSVM